MSLIETLSASLASIGFLQLALAFAALASYAIAINTSLPARWRSGATFTALAAAAVFAVLTPSWMGGVALMLMAVLVMAAFAAATWLLASAFGLDTDREPVATLALDAQERGLRPVRAASRPAAVTVA